MKKFEELIKKAPQDWTIKELSIVVLEDAIREKIALDHDKHYTRIFDVGGSIKEDKGTSTGPININSLLPKYNEKDLIIIDQYYAMYNWLMYKKMNINTNVAVKISSYNDLVNIMEKLIVAERLKDRLSNNLDLVDTLHEDLVHFLTNYSLNDFIKNKQEVERLMDCRMYIEEGSKDMMNLNIIIDLLIKIYEIPSLEYYKAPPLAFENTESRKEYERCYNSLLEIAENKCNRRLLPYLKGVFDPKQLDQPKKPSNELIKRTKEWLADYSNIKKELDVTPFFILQGDK